MKNNKHKHLKYLVLFLVVSFSQLLSSQDWKKDYKEALALAESENKPLIVVFSGSDWCPPCKKLNKQVWKSETFIDYSNANYVLYNADFPRKKANKLSAEIIAQNKELAERFNPKAHYPKVLVLDKSEKILGETTYKKISPQAYIDLLNSFL